MGTIISKHSAKYLRWSIYTNYVDGWLPRAAVIVPIIGYVILFNDQITPFFSFSDLAGSTQSFMNLGNLDRLRLIYFGLVFLGVSNFIYRMARPKALEKGNTESEYVKEAFETYSSRDYTEIHYIIRSQYQKEHGKVMMSNPEWESFSEDTDFVSHSIGETWPETSTWDASKAKYGSLLIDYIKHEYTLANRSNQKWLFFVLVLSTIGYILLLVPSIDIFERVLRISL